MTADSRSQDENHEYTPDADGYYPATGQLMEDGHGLNRPECVLTHSSGLLFAPDWQGNRGVSIGRPDGQVRRIEARAHGTPSTARDSDIPLPLRPNGIALESDGRFLLAHLGDTTGGIYRLHPDGHVDVVVDRVFDPATGQNTAMPPANFIVADSRQRLWITVSTRVTPRADDYRAGACTGFIALAGPGERTARIVADGLGYTNECVVDEIDRFVHVNETFGRRLTRFALADDGSLSAATVIANFGEGVYPDGLALDTEGGLLITSIVSNRVLRIAPDGTIDTLVDDSDADHVAWTEAAYRRDALGRQHLDQARSKRLKNISNLAFGGADMCTAWLGNLLGHSLPRFRVVVPGVPMTHHDVPLGKLLDPDVGVAVGMRTP